VAWLYEASRHSALPHVLRVQNAAPPTGRLLLRAVRVQLSPVRLPVDPAVARPRVWAWPR
jgi:hypothetical protein